MDFFKRRLSLAKTNWDYWLPLAFYLSLYFNINNRTLLMIFGGFLLIYWKRLSSLLLAFFALYLLFLPVPKGKTFELTLIPSWMLGSSQPFLFSFTVSFSDVAIFLFFLIALKQVLFRPLKKLIAGVRREDFFLIGFLFFILVSISVSPQPLISWLAFLNLLPMVFVYFVARQMSKEEKFRQLVVGILIASLLFEGSWALGQFLYGGPLGRAVESFGGQFSPYGYLAAEARTFFRAQGTLEHPNTLGSLLAVLLLFAVSLFRFPSVKRILPLAVLLGILGLLFSGSRASWAVALLGLSALVIFFKFLPKVYLLILGISLVLGLPLVIIPRLLHLYQTAALYGGIHYRLYLLEKAWVLAQSSPFGVGIGTFPVALVENFGFFTWPSPVHNIFGEVLVETGLGGLLAFALFLIYSYQDFWKRRQGYSARESPLKIGAFFAASAFLLLAQFYPFFTSSSIFDYFWLFLGLML